MLIECAGCHEPLFDDMKVCPQCGAANPTYQAPRWRRNALVGGLVLIAIIVGSIVSSIVGDLVPAVYVMLGVAFLSIAGGLVALWNRGPKTLLLWVVGNGGLFVLAFIATLGAFLVLHVRIPFFLIYAGGASLLLRRLSSRPNAA